MVIASLRRRFVQGSESQYCFAEAASNGLFGRRQCIADRLRVPSLRREFLLSAGEVVAGDLMHRGALSRRVVLAVRPVVE
jgi:hypothetical protein